MDPALIAAYQATDYLVDDSGHHFTLRIGEYSPPLAGLLETLGRNQAAFISAYNPHSRETSQAKNEAANSDLEKELLAAGCLLFKGAGESRSGDWPPEPSFLVFGLSQSDAGAFGRRFGQNAILWVDQACIPKLVLLNDRKP